MAHKLPTKDVDKIYYSNYLRKAMECFHAAKSSFTKQEWNAVAISIIHCCIAARDAMCVYFLGKRSISDNHNETAVLFKTIGSSEEINTNTNRIMRILRIKNMAEYEERLVFKSEAEKILHDCERFLDFVNKELPKID